MTTAPRPHGPTAPRPHGPTAPRLHGSTALRRLALLLFVGELTAPAMGQPFIPRDVDDQGYSQRWVFLPNQGQVFDLDGNSRADVLYHSVGTVPSVYAMVNARTAVTFPAYDTLDHENDAVCRIDMMPTGEDVADPDPILWDPTQMKYNFYETYTPQGITGVTGGMRVIYEDIYPSIDYHILSNPYGPKFLFVVRPGGDPADLMLQFNGQDSIHVDYMGMLRLYVGNKQLRLNEAWAYQQIGNTVVPVSWTPNYQNNEGSALVTLDIGSYDQALPLIFQLTPLQAALPPPPPSGPLPEWCTYIPGAGAEDFIADLTPGINGYIHYTGHSNSSSGLPINGGSFIQSNLAGSSDAIIGRFSQYYETNVDPDAWLTYYGSNGLDKGLSIAVNASNDQVAACGLALSNVSDLITPFGSVSDQWTGWDFMAVFNMTTGIVEYGTRIPNASGNAIDVDYDPNGNLYLIGMASMDFSSWPYVDLPGSSDYFAQSQFQIGTLQFDVFIMRFNDQMDLTWSTAYGGPNDEVAHTCRVSPATGELYIGGYTRSSIDPNNPNCPPNGWTGFPICDAGGFTQGNIGGTEDGFIARFDLATMGMTWSSYFGGWQSDWITDIAIDDNSRVYICGSSNSTGYANTACGWVPGDEFPACNNGQYFEGIVTGSGDNHFLARFEPTTALSWSTLIQGSRIESVSSIARTRVACDPSGNIYLQGSTQSGCGMTDETPAATFYDPSFYHRNAHNDFQSSSNVIPYFDVYIAAFDPFGGPLYGTFFGGLGDDWSGGICVLDDRLYTSGGTQASAQFPVNAPTIPGHTPYLSTSSNTIGDIDGYFAQLRYDLTLGFHPTSSSSTPELNIYPNPTSTLLFIAFNKISTIRQLKVVDATGRLVLSETISNAMSHEIDISFLNPGVYSILATGHNERASARFIVD